MLLVCSFNFNRHFGNVYDFVYQAYQISISNFTHNTLFRQFALQDLSDLFHLKLQVFHKLSRHNDDSFKITTYEPAKGTKANGHGNDGTSTAEYICMLNDESDTIKYKWLMPVKSKPLFNERFLTSSFRVSELAKRPKRRLRAKHFFKVSSLYTHHMFVVNSSEIYKCFDDASAPAPSHVVNHMIFAFFLKEAPVQTIMYKKDMSFGEILARNDPAYTVRCLNNLWGKPHFQLNELLSLAHSSTTTGTSQHQKVRKPHRNSRKSKKNLPKQQQAVPTPTATSK